MTSVNIQGNIVRFDQWPVVINIMILFSSVLAATCVPLFFIISGYLLFFKIEKYNRFTYINKLKSRSKSLLVPYIIWNFVGFFILLVELHPAFSHFFPLLKDYKIDIIKFLSYFWVADLPISMNGPANPINTPLWYIRDLLVLVSISPIIYWLIKRMRVAFILILAIIWFFSLGEHIQFPGLCHQSLFFFPLGAYLGIYKINFVLLFNKMKWAPAIYILFAFADVLTMGQGYNYIVHNLGIIIGIISIVCICSSLLIKEKITPNQFLSNSSFFVFALHNLFIGKMTKIILMLFPFHSPFFILTIYFLTPIITITICLYIYKVLYNISPTMIKVLTGGRQ